MFLLHFQTKDTDMHAYVPSGTLKMVTETSKTTNFQAHVFYNAFLYWLTNLLIAITFLCLLVNFFRLVKQNQQNNQS